MTDARVGRCGARSPAVAPYTTTCSLPHGHAGWHLADNGSEWTSEGPSKHDVGPAEWALVLADWKRSDANVTVHLRSGAALGPGKVSRLPGGDGVGSGELRAAERGPYGDPERVWTFDANEIAAVTAEATR